MAASAIAHRERETEFEETCVVKNWTHREKKPQGHGLPECALSFLLCLLRLVGEL